MVIGVAVAAVLAAGIVVAALPEMLLPDAASGADDALTALKDARTVTVTATATSDDAPFFGASVRRTTTGEDRVVGDFRHLAMTATYPYVQVREVGPTVYAKNYSESGTTPWVRLDTTGGDDLSLAMAAVDPTALLRFAGTNAENALASRDGMFGMKYSVFCADCTDPLLGAADDGTTGTTGDDTAADPGLQYEIHLDFVVDLRGRPTSITLRVTAGNTVDRRMTLRLSDFGAPLTVREPAGATPSPAPGAMTP
ncbi:hypothetical protein GCM10022220_29690 [Actinocatenispora rupis]|uniref:Uncharacterized protein n=1 Tax=Actinocatenispora rupis TaxID=519421 RepID=A0A8J3J241_9ACTN|nr:hypothetical protein Aru02nite_40290 [Actinocatenispora rupis]